MNYKGKLFEISSKRPGLGRPEYSCLEFGPLQNKQFASKCTFEGFTTVHFASTKTEAEQLATKDLLQLINKNVSSKREIIGLKRNSSISPEINEILTELPDDPQQSIFLMYGEVLLQYYLANYLFITFPTLSEEMFTQILSETMNDDETHFMVTKLLGLRLFGETEVTVEKARRIVLALIGKAEFIHSDNLCEEFIFPHYHIPLHLIVFQVLSTKPYIETPPTPPSPAFSASTATALSYASTPVMPSMDYTKPSHSYKNELQELAQKRAGLFPVYSPPTRTGPDHSPIFAVTCTYEGFMTRGEGRTRKDAEQVAARNLLMLLQGGGGVAGGRSGTPNVAPLPPPLYANPPPPSMNPTIPQANRVKEVLKWPYPLKEEGIVHVFTPSSLNHRRLKFLGHSLLPKILLTDLLDKYPDRSFEDANMTRKLLNRLILPTQLIAVAKGLQLDQFLPSSSLVSIKVVLSDVFEALVAMLFTEEGIDTSTVITHILSWFKPVIDRVLSTEKDEDWKEVPSMTSSFHDTLSEQDERVVHLRLSKNAEYVTEVYSDGGYEAIVKHGHQGSNTRQVKSLEQQLSNLSVTNRKEEDADVDNNDDDGDSSPEVTITLKNVKANTFTISLKFLNQENMKIEIKPKKH